MDTWVATVRIGQVGGGRMVQVAASNLTTALKRVVEEAYPEYGPRRGYKLGLDKGGKLPPGGEVLVIHIRRMAKEAKSP